MWIFNCRSNKSLDLNRLFDLLMTEDDVFEFFPEDEIPGGEPHTFSLQLCMDAVRSGKPYVYQQVGQWFIQDSLTCEYGYDCPEHRGERQSGSLQGRLPEH